MEAITNEEGNKYVGYTKEELSQTHISVKNMDRNTWVNRAYNRPGLMVGMLREEHEHFAGILQWRYGLRITEATHIKIKQLAGNTLTVYGKGGFLQIVELSDEDVEELKRVSADGLYIEIKPINNE